MTTEMLEKLDLSQGALGEDLLAEDICDFLDCYTFAGLVVRCSTWDEGDQHAGLGRLDDCGKWPRLGEEAHQTMP